MRKTLSFSEADPLFWLSAGFFALATGIDLWTHQWWAAAVLTGCLVVLVGIREAMHKVLVLLDTQKVLLDTRIQHAEAESALVQETLAKVRAATSFQLAMDRDEPTTPH